MGSSSDLMDLGDFLGGDLIGRFWEGRRGVRFRTGEGEGKVLELAMVSKWVWAGNKLVLLGLGLLFKCSI